jgi:hypothetical protein
VRTTKCHTFAVALLVQLAVTQEPPKLPSANSVGPSLTRVMRMPKGVGGLKA